MAGVLCEPVQHDEEFVGFGSTMQSLLHPTAAPVESKGPFRVVGQMGPRSTRQLAVPHPAVLVIFMGRLKPSTRDTSE